MTAEKTGTGISGQRNCEGCAMCCMMLSIKSLDKPKHTWCTHCSTKQSCDIYAERPGECRSFHCGYLSFPELGEEWKPSRSKILLVGELNGKRITAYVDPKRPDAWRQEPFYSTLKKWSGAARAKGGQVVVCVDRRLYLILPDRDVDAGIITEGMAVMGK